MFKLAWTLSSDRQQIEAIFTPEMKLFLLSALVNSRQMVKNSFVRFKDVSLFVWSCSQSSVQRREGARA